MSPTTTEDQTILAVTPPLNPGVPMEHRAGEAAVRPAAIRMAEMRLGALWESRGVVVSQIKKLPAQTWLGRPLPLQGYQAHRWLSGPRFEENPWRRREGRRARSRVLLVVGRHLLQDWVRQPHLRAPPLRRSLQQCVRMQLERGVR